MLDTALVSLCESVIAELPAIEDPHRANIAAALSTFATALRDELERNGNFMKLAKTLETQAGDLADSEQRLAYVRKEVQAIYRGLSEQSPQRTRLVAVDEHLGAIEKTLVPLAPVRGEAV